MLDCFASNDEKHTTIGLALVKRRKTFGLGYLPNKSQAKNQAKCLPNDTKPNTQCHARQTGIKLPAQRARRPTHHKNLRFWVPAQQKPSKNQAKCLPNDTKPNTQCHARQTGIKLPAQRARRPTHHKNLRLGVLAQQKPTKTKPSAQTSQPAKHYSQTKTNPSAQRHQVRQSKTKPNITPSAQSIPP